MDSSMTRILFVMVSRLLLLSCQRRIQRKIFLTQGTLEISREIPPYSVNTDDYNFILKTHARLETTWIISNHTRWNLRRTGRKSFTNKISFINWMQPQVAAAIIESHSGNESETVQAVVTYEAELFLSRYTLTIHQ